MKIIILLSILLSISTITIADQIYSKQDVLNAVSGIAVSGRVEHPKVIKDITPTNSCQKQGTGVVGFGHEEVTICPDGASGLKDLQESSQGTVTRWKGNPQIGYYKIREDGSIDTSYWRQSIGGILA
jgi:hypothetical protein